MCLNVYLQNLSAFDLILVEFNWANVKVVENNEREDLLDVQVLEYRPVSHLQAFHFLQMGLVAKHKLLVGENQCAYLLRSLLSFQSRATIIALIEYLKQLELKEERLKNTVSRHSVYFSKHE